MKSYRDKKADLDRNENDPKESTDACSKVEFVNLPDKCNRLEINQTRHSGDDDRGQDGIGSVFK